MRIKYNWFPNLHFQMSFFTHYIFDKMHSFCFLFVWGFFSWHFKETWDWLYLNHFLNQDLDPIKFLSVWGPSSGHMGPIQLPSLQAPLICLFCPWHFFPLFIFLLHVSLLFNTWEVINIIRNVAALGWLTYLNESGNLKRVWKHNAGLSVNSRGNLFRLQSRTHTRPANTVCPSSLSNRFSFNRGPKSQFAWLINVKDTSDRSTGVQGA